MDRAEFIQLILYKKNLDKEIFDKSLEIDDFPLAYSILNAISGQTTLIENIVNPKKINEIDYAVGELKRLCINNRKDIKQEGLKFINDLASSSKLNFRLEQQRAFEDEKNEVILGIDLGTTNTVVSYFLNGKAEIIPLENGNRLLPSVVAVNKNKKFDVGTVAYNQRIINPKDTYYSIKRFIGRRSKDINKTILKDYPFKLDLSGEKVKIYSPKLKKKFDCEEISAQILRKAKFEAENFLKKEISKCVITVPAYFDNNQVVATKRAAEIAGFQKIERIVKEPTAAAFAYEMEKSSGTSNTLVCDLGGGTFDISLIKKIGSDVDSLSVTATLGDSNLGGDDYTNLFANAIRDLIIKENDQVKFDLSIEALLKDEVLKVKHLLSIQNEVEINLPVLPTSKGETFSFSKTITREFFDEITKIKTNQIEELLKKFLNDKKVKNKKINKVVSVGGASRMPLYLSLLKKVTGLTPQIDNNPDEIVAKGAAYFAEYTTKPNSSKLIIDVNPLSLGIEVRDQEIDNIYDVIVPANTSLPIEFSKTYTTTVDFQTSILIAVFQGERKFAEDNIFLGDFILEGIESNLEGIPKILVTFRLSIDGILKVTAKDLKTNSENNIVIRNPNDIPQKTIDRLKAYAEKMGEKDNLKLTMLRKLINLSLLMKIFNDINEPVLSSSDEITLDEIKTILEGNSATQEELDDLIRLLRIIIKEQESFKFDDDEVEEQDEDEDKDEDEDEDEDEDLI